MSAENTLVNIQLSRRPTSTHAFSPMCFALSRRSFALSRILPRTSSRPSLITAPVSVRSARVTSGDILSTNGGIVLDAFVQHFASCAIQMLEGCTHKLPEILANGVEIAQKKWISFRISNTCDYRFPLHWREHCTVTLRAATEPHTLPVSLTQCIAAVADTVNADFTRFLVSFFT